MMPDPAIKTFLDKRKTAWLANKIKGNTTEEEQAILEQQATDNFALATWLPSAAKRAKQLPAMSHPAKFSHSSAKATPIIATAKASADGFLRTGNAKTSLDASGNAAAMDVYTFLNLTLLDGKTILTHLKEKTATIEQELTIPTAVFSEIEQGLLASVNHGTTVKTDARIKQVYFPIEDAQYHLLSILTPSGLTFEMKKRINEMRFADTAKAARQAKRENAFNATGFADIFDLSVIGYGGSKPQIISVLNSQNYGKAYLLPCLPPTLKNKGIIPPKKDFFINTLWLKRYEADFKKLHKTLQTLHSQNNIHYRDKRDRQIRNMINNTADTLWLIRQLDAGWSADVRYRKLPHAQKIWLDQHYAQEREKDDAWFAEIQQGLAEWFILSYDKTIKDNGNKIYLDAEQLSYIKKMINACKDLLL